MTKTVEYISLDFYDNSFVSVKTKQGDINSRIINVTCKNRGNKVFIDSGYTSAFVRVKKSDGHNACYEAEILEDGTIQFVIRQQMVASSGRQLVDLMIFATQSITSDDLLNLDFVLENIPVISVMPFYLISINPPIDNTTITSSDDFDALTQSIVQLKSLETKVRSEEENRQNAELKRQDNITGEIYRIENEKERIASENIRKIRTSEMVESYESAIKTANTALDSCKETINLVDDKLKEMDETVNDVLSSLESNNLNINHGANNSGKIFVVNDDGNVTLLHNVRMNYDGQKNALIVSFNSNE